MSDMDPGLCRDDDLIGSIFFCGAAPHYFFNSARKLGVAIIPIRACFEVIVAVPGGPAAPWVGPERWVTCAEYIPSVIVVARVAAENPVTPVPGFTTPVAVQVMLGLPGMSSGSTNG